MKDRWMNIGFEDDELKPYMEPEADLNDQARIRESTHTHTQHVQVQVLNGQGAIYSSSSVL